ncbi:MAG: hypothetical protein QXI09_02100 [Candidatus Aenigmatarchaeota archaeon]
MKVVSEIVSVVLILALSLGLISTVLMYGYPMIAKAQDKGALERVISVFSPDIPNSISKRMEYVSKFGGSTTINLEVNGVWEAVSFDDTSEMKNSLSYIFLSRVTNVNSDQYISLSLGEKCPPENGIFGINSPFVVCVKGESSQTGFSIKYTVFARNLTSEDQVYFVKLKPVDGNRIQSTSKSIRIERSNIETVYEGNKKVIIVTLEISL